MLVGQGEENDAQLTCEELLSAQGTASVRRTPSEGRAERRRESADGHTLLGGGGSRDERADDGVAWLLARWS